MGHYSKTDREVLTSSLQGDAEVARCRHQTTTIVEPRPADAIIAKLEIYTFCIMRTLMRADSALINHGCGCKCGRR